MDDEEATEYVSARWSWVRFALRFVELVGNMARSFANLADSVTEDMVMHVNHQIDQRGFEDEARLSIDSIPSTEEG